MKLFNFSILYKKSFLYLRKLCFQLKTSLFGFLGKNKKFLENSTDNNAQQKEFDKKLVHSLSKSRIPSMRQIKYAGKILNKKERLVLRISFVVLAVSALSWAAVFYFSHLQTVPVRGGVYKEAMLGVPKYINPLYNSLSDVDNDLSALIFSSLYKRGANGELKTDLVTEISVSEDTKVYTFKVTDQAVWHDDEPLTARDIAFTFSAMKDLQYKSTFRESFDGVEIEVMGDYEFRFILSEPYAAFLDLLTFGIMPAHLWSQIPPDSAQLAELNFKPIGSGPYELEGWAKDKNGVIKEYTLVINDSYYAKKPLLGLQFYFYNTIDEAIDALNNEVVDGISYLPFDRKEFILTPNGYAFEKLHLPQLTLIFFNQKNNPSLQDKSVRQALSYAIDRNGIVNDVLGGNAYLADGPILGSSFAYFQDIKKYNFSPSEASQLLENTDWKLTEIGAEEIEAAKQETEDEDEQAKNNQTLTLGEGKWRIKDDNYLVVNLKTVDRGENAAVLEKIKNYWEAIGVKTNIEIVDVAQIQSGVIKPRNFDAFFYGQILGADPDPYFFWHSSQTGENGYNIADFASKEVDALLEDARQNSDLNFRQKKYIEFQKIISEEQPAIFMYSPVYTYVHFNKLKGFSVNNILLPRDRFSNIEDWYVKVGKRLVFN